MAADARRLVLEAYDMAARMQSLDLAAVNQPHLPNLRFRSQDELVRHFESRAGAMLQFASDLGLLDAADSLAILKEVAAKYPELSAPER